MVALSWPMGSFTVGLSLSFALSLLLSVTCLLGGAALLGVLLWFVSSWPELSPASLALSNKKGGGRARTADWGVAALVPRS